MSIRTHRYRLCAERGMSINEVARLYEVTPHAIRLANRKHNLGFDTKPSPRDRDLAAMRERVEAMRASGKNSRHISVALGVPVPTVSRWCRMWGVSFAPGKSSGRRSVLEILGDRLSASEADDVRLLKRKKYTLREAFVAIKRPDLLECL